MGSYCLLFFAVFCYFRLFTWVSVVYLYLIISFSAINMRPFVFFFFYGFQIRCRCNEGRLCSVSQTQSTCDLNVRMVTCLPTLTLVLLCRLREDNLLQAKMNKAIPLLGEIFQLPGLSWFWTCTLQEHLLVIYQLYLTLATASILYVIWENVLNFFQVLLLNLNFKHTISVMVLYSFI